MKNNVFLKYINTDELNSLRNGLSSKEFDRLIEIIDSLSYDGLRKNLESSRSLKNKMDNDGYFFVSLALTNENLFTLKDQDGNNIIHTLLKVFQYEYNILNYKNYKEAF